MADMNVSTFVFCGVTLELSHITLITLREWGWDNPSTFLSQQTVPALSVEFGINERE